MIFVFEDGRMVFSRELLRPEDKGKFVEVEALPVVAAGATQQVRFYADLKRKKVKHVVIDIPLPESEEGSDD